MQAEYPRRLNLGLTLPSGAVDADANPGLVERYQALSLPTCKLIRGGEVVTTLVGARPRPALDAALLPHL